MCPQAKWPPIKKKKKEWCFHTMVFCSWDHFSALEKVEFRDLLTTWMSLTDKWVRSTETHSKEQGQLGFSLQRAFWMKITLPGSTAVCLSAAPGTLRQALWCGQWGIETGPTWGMLNVQRDSGSPRYSDCRFSRLTPINTLTTKYLIWKGVSGAWT